MKKYIQILTSSCVLALITGCASTGTPSTGATLGTAVVKTLVDTKCRQELNNRKEWRLLSIAMSAQKKAEWETKICGCASEEALNTTTVVDMAQVVNPSTRPQAVAAITERTVKACIARLR